MRGLSATVRPSAGRLPSPPSSGFARQFRHNASKAFETAAGKMRPPQAERKSSLLFKTNPFVLRDPTGENAGVECPRTIQAAHGG